MLRRALSLASGLLGVIVLLAAGYGYLNADAANAPAGADPGAWLSHFRRTTGAYSIVAAIVVIGSILISTGRAYGVLLAGGAFAAAAAMPWLVSALG